MSMLPNFAVKWLTLLFHVREVLGLDLDLDTRYPDKFLLALGPAKSVPEALGPGVKGVELEADSEHRAHLLVSRLCVHGAIPPLPHGA
jgi:hypothetical protein